MMSVPQQIKCAYDVRAGTNQMYMPRLCQTKLKCVRGILFTLNRVTCLSTYLCQIKLNVRMKSVPEQIKCAYDARAGTNQMYMSRLCQTKLKCVRGVLVTLNQVTCLSTYLCLIKSTVRVCPSQSLSNVR